MKDFFLTVFRILGYLTAACIRRFMHKFVCVKIYHKNGIVKFFLERIDNILDFS